MSWRHFLTKAKMSHLEAYRVLEMAEGLPLAAVKDQYRRLAKHLPCDQRCYGRLNQPLTSNFNLSNALTICSTARRSALKLRSARSMSDKFS